MNRWLLGALLSMFVLGTIVVYRTGSSKPKTCKPPSKEELGHLTWIYLHTMASNFPVEEEADEQKQLTKIKSFLKTFGEIYPCRYCGEHFQQMLQKSPPKISSRGDFEVWLWYVFQPKRV